MLQDTVTRRRYVDWVLRFTQGTSLHPGSYERQLLAHYVAGQLTLDQVSVLAELHRLYPTEAATALQTILRQQPDNADPSRLTLDADGASSAASFSQRLGG